MKLLISLLLLAFMIGDVSARETKNVLSNQQQKIIEEDGYEELIFDRVIDGDTFIASGKRIRLWGIDAPEKDEEMYQICSKALELFLETGRLECKLINFDRYDRHVMHCNSDGSDVGGLMVKTGFAEDYQKYSGGFYRQEEAFAREGKLGVWE